MRIIIRFTRNLENVPFKNQSSINSYIHKCLGKNNVYHDSKNDYCISSLQGGKISLDKKYLIFNDGGYITITSENSEFLNELLAGVMSNQDFKWGMKFKMIDFIKEEFVDGWNSFSTLSPFIIKKYSNKKKYSFSTIYDDDFCDVVKKHTIKKLSKMYDGINLSDFEIQIKKHQSHKIKKILVKNVINKANQCRFSVFCSAKVAEKLYNIGIGQSTGSGFGTIYKIENHDKYRLE